MSAPPKILLVGKAFGASQPQLGWARQPDLSHRLSWNLGFTGKKGFFIRIPPKAVVPAMICTGIFDIVNSL